MFSEKCKNKAHKIWIDECLKIVDHGSEAQITLNLLSQIKNIIYETSLFPHCIVEHVLLDYIQIDWAIALLKPHYKWPQVILAYPLQSMNKTIIKILNMVRKVDIDAISQNIFIGAAFTTLSTLLNDPVRLVSLSLNISHPITRRFCTKNGKIWGLSIQDGYIWLHVSPQTRYKIRHIIYHDFIIHAVHGDEAVEVHLINEFNCIQSRINIYLTQPGEWDHRVTSNKGFEIMMPLYKFNFSEEIQKKLLNDCELDQHFIVSSFVVADKMNYLKEDTIYDINSFA